MTRRPASVTQADVARVIRAAKQAGATEVEVRIKDQASIVIRLAVSTERTEGIAVNQEVVL
jgi:hypothetical protein